MYLVSLYFDEKTTTCIQKYIDTVAMRTGNSYMKDGKVPPHITVSAFEAKQEGQIIAALDDCVKQLHKGVLQWVSVGAFFPYVIYLSPVLNAYLHGVSDAVYNGIKDEEDILIHKCYMPFQWQPHTTIGKKLSKEEMQIAFSTLQESFGMFSGESVKIGLARTNPYEDIAVWDLK